MTNFKINPESAKGVAIILGALLAVFIVITILKKGTAGFESLLESLGLKDTAEEKAAKQAIDSAIQQSGTSESAFNPNFYKKYPSFQKPMWNDISNIAYLVYDSVGYISDNSEEAVSAFKKLESKCEVSYMSEAFATLFKKDLLSYLSYHFDTRQQKVDLQNIINYVNNLKTV